MSNHGGWKGCRRRHPAAGGRLWCDLCGEQVAGDFRVLVAQFLDEPIGGHVACVGRLVRELEIAGAEYLGDRRMGGVDGAA